MCNSPNHDNMQHSCFSMLSLPSLGEMEQTICMLERGTIITKYYPRRRPEQKTLMLRRETRQVGTINIYYSEIPWDKLIAVVTSCLRFIEFFAT